MRLAAEERHLRLADDHLAKADLRIQAQEERIQEMERDGLDAQESLKPLTILRETRRLMENHREQILEAIAKQTR